MMVACEEYTTEIPQMLKFISFLKKMQPHFPTAESKMQKQIIINNFHQVA